LYFIKTWLMRKYAILYLGLLLTSCTNNKPSPDELATQQAKLFADSYFNYDYTSALALITPESAKWLQFAASNITQNDIDQLNAHNEEVTTDVTDLLWIDDTTALATIEAANYLLKDSIGRNMRRMDEGTFQIKIVERQGQYYIKMEGLPRSERQSPDSDVDE